MGAGQSARLFRYNAGMRKFLMAVLLLLGLVFILTYFAEMQEVWRILRTGYWWYVALAALVEAAWMLNLSASYQSVYRIVGLDESYRRLIYLSSAAFFVNVVTPASGGVPAIALFLADAGKRGHSRGRVMAAYALNLLFEYAGLLVVVTLGLAVLARRNHLEWSEVGASLVLLVVALGLTGLLYLGMKSADTLARVLAWAARGVNYAARPFSRKRPFVEESRAYTFAHEIAEGIQALRGEPRLLVRPLLLALSNKALHLSILTLMFLAFDVPFTAGTIFGSFGIGYLFVIVSPTPAGIGIVEGVLVLVMKTLLVPLDAATIITLSYRGVTFWLPLLVGMISFRVGHRLDDGPVGES